MQRCSNVFVPFEESSLTFDGFAAHEGSKKQGNGKGGLKLLIHRDIASKYIYYTIYIDMLNYSRKTPYP